MIIGITIGAAIGVSIGVTLGKRKLYINTVYSQKDRMQYLDSAAKKIFLTAHF